MSGPHRQDLRETRVYPSLVRPILLAGIERELMVPLVGLVLMLLLGFRLNLVTPALAGGIVFVVLPWLRRLHRRDPQTFSVLKEHLRVAGFYPGQARHDQPRRARGRSLP